MAFKVVTIADRISQYPDRRRLTKEDGSSELVTVAAEEGSVSAEGTEWGAAYANDLETRIDAETHLLESNFGIVETTITASKAYAVGQCLILNGQLYKVIAPISVGSTLIIGTNIAVHSVSAINKNINVYVGEDKKLHFVNGSGADSALPFKSGAEIVTGSVTTATVGGARNVTVEKVPDIIYLKLGTASTALYAPGIPFGILPGTGYQENYFSHSPSGVSANVTANTLSAPTIDLTPLTPYGTTYSGRVDYAFIYFNND